MNRRVVLALLAISFLAMVGFALAFDLPDFGPKSCGSEGICVQPFDGEEVVLGVAITGLVACSVMALPRDAKSHEEQP